MTQKKIAPIIKDRIPRFILEDYPKFVNFLDAYNQFLENDRIIGIELADLVSILDQASVFDTDMNERPVPLDEIALGAHKVFSDSISLIDAGLILEPGKYLNDIILAIDAITSSQIAMFIAEGSYLVNNDDYVEPIYVEANPFIIDEFAITDITRGVVDTIVATDVIYNLLNKIAADTTSATDSVLPFSIDLGKSESVNITEVISKVLSTTIADNATPNESIALLLSTIKGEIVSNIVDNISSRTLDKVSADTANLVDAIVTREILKLAQDNPEVIEQLGYILNNAKQEFSYASDSVQNFGIQKGLADLASPIDIPALELATIVDDIVNVVETISINIFNSLADTGDYPEQTDYVDSSYFGGSIDENVDIT